MNMELSRDESDLENINVKTRPMTIMEDYTLFCSQEWLAAKTDVDELAERARLDIDDGVRCTILTHTLKVIVTLFYPETGHCPRRLHPPTTSLGHYPLPQVMP